MSLYTLSDVLLHTVYQTVYTVLIQTCPRFHDCNFSVCYFLADFFHSISHDLPNIFYWFHYGHVILCIGKVCCVALSCCKTWRKSFVTILDNSNSSPKISQYLITDIFILSETKGIESYLLNQPHTVTAGYEFGTILGQFFKFCPPFSSTYGKLKSTFFHKKRFKFEIWWTIHHAYLRLPFKKSFQIIIHCSHWYVCYFT